MKMSIDIDQFSHLEKLARLTQLYLELRLPLPGAIRAAAADLPECWFLSYQRWSFEQPLQQLGKKARLWESGVYGLELQRQLLRHQKLELGL